MLAIEPYLVEMITQLKKKRVPISSRQGLALANSMISGTAYEEKVLEWKETHCVSFRNNVEGKPMVLGKGYWAGFMKQNKHLVKARKGVKFDSKRADLCTHQNFQRMYEEVYGAMVLGGIASKLDTPVWFDKHGNIVEQDTAHLAWHPSTTYRNPISFCLLTKREAIQAKQRMAT